MDLLSTRLRNALLRAGVRSVAQLARLTEEDLLRVHGVGVKYLPEIQALVSGFGETTRAPGVAPKPGPGAADPPNYRAVLPALMEANRLDLGAETALSPGSLAGLRAEGLATPASLILIAPAELARLPSFSPRMVRELADAQRRLAAGLDLLRVAGTAKLRVVQRLGRELHDLALIERAREAKADLHRHFEVVQAEIDAGRLCEEVVVGELAGRLGPGSTLAEYSARARKLRPSFGGAAEVIEWASVLRPLVEALQVRTVDEELSVLLQGVPERQLSVLRLRLGTEAPPTLQQVADPLGLTRERVRQIQLKGERCLARALLRRLSPRARSAVRFALQASASGGLPAAEADLRERGLVWSARAFEDLIVLWRSTEAELAQPFPTALLATGAPAVPSQDQIKLWKRVTLPAASLCRNTGAFRIESLRPPEGGPIADLGAGLAHLGYEPLLPGWWYHPILSRVGIEPVAHAVFSMVGVVPPAELSLSLRRHLSRRGMESPPAEVVAQVAVRLGLCREDGGLLRAAARPDPESVLRGAELVLYRHLCSRGGMTHRREIEAAIQAAGYSSHTATSLLQHSPIVRNLGIGLHALVGTTVTPSARATALERAGYVHPAGDLRWDGNSPTVAYYYATVTPRLIATGVLDSPQLRSFAGAWLAHNERAVRIQHRGRTLMLRPFAAVRVTRGAITGLRPYVEELGLRVRERIRIRIDTAERTMRLERAGDAGREDL